VGGGATDTAGEGSLQIPQGGRRTDTTGEEVSTDTAGGVLAYTAGRGPL